MSGVRGKSGPRYKPTQVKQLAGTLRPDRVNHNEPVGPILGKMPPCPSHLNGEARKTWSKVGRALIDMGVLTGVDLQGLEAYCVVYARWQEAEKKLADSGQLIVWGGKDGLTQGPSPYLRIAEDSLKQMRAWMNEFGITPSSRSRVKVEKKAPVADPEDWFGDLHRN